MTGFEEIVVVVVIAVGCGFLAHLLRQPVVVGFIAAGLLICYFERFQLAHIDFIEGLASIGVALLLFLVGLEMSIKDWRRINVLALLVGLGQIAFTFTAGFLISLALGFNSLSAFYVAAALTLSSTIIVIKILSEKKDLRSLYGRVVIGILVLQDFVAITLLLFLTSLEPGGSIKDSLSFEGLVALGKAMSLIPVVIIISKLLPRVLDTIGRSPEMLYLFSIAWALGISFLAVTAGLSIEAGGFLAGLALANSSEQFQIGVRLRPLRDFFIILFFVILGVRAFGGLGSVSLFDAGALAAFVLVGGPLIVLLVMSALGYRARTSFLVGLAIAQVSEFSFIIAALGDRLGHIGQTEVSLITLVGLTTIFISSYFMVHNSRLYEFLRPLVKPFEFRRQSVEEAPLEVELSNHIILVGVHRMGEGIMRALSNSTYQFMALDFDPTIVKKLSRIGIPVLYGDITEDEVKERMGIRKAKMVISTVPDFKDNLDLIKEMRKRNAKAKVILAAEDEWSAKELYKEGADYVLLPHLLGGREIAQVISEDHNFKSLTELKKRDLKVIGSV